MIRWFLDQFRDITIAMKLYTLIAYCISAYIFANIWTEVSISGIDFTKTNATSIINYYEVVVKQTVILTYTFFKFKFGKPFNGICPWFHGKLIIEKSASSNTKLITCYYHDLECYHINFNFVHMLITKGFYLMYATKCIDKILKGHWT